MQLSGVLLHVLGVLGVFLPSAVLSSASPSPVGPTSRTNITGRPGQMNDQVEERLIVLDTDAGGDDALALLVLLAGEQTIAGSDGPQTRVLAVTCVSGNTGVHNVTRNVLATLRTAGRLDLPVFRGAAKSLVFTPSTDSFFGSDGFGNFLPADLGVGKVQQEHAANALVRMAAERPGRITLVCLGPLTNVALASRLDPSFMDNLADVFIVGGSARGRGNTKAATEFNVYMDPESFQVVLDGVKNPAYTLPWETDVKLNISKEWRRDVLGAVKSSQMQFLNQAEKVSLGGRGSHWSVIDGLLALSVLRPDVIRSRTTTRMDVVLGDGAARAVTLVDFVNKNPKPRNVVLLEEADEDLTKCLLLQLLDTPTTDARRSGKLKTRRCKRYL